MALVGLSTATASAAGSGHIKGTVTADDGTKLSGISVSAYGYDPTGQYLFAQATTDGQGAYDLANLADADYTVSFQSPGGDYATEYWKNASQYYDATPVTVAGGATVSGISPALSPAGAISGTIKDSAGTGLGSVNVSAYRYVTDQYNGYWSTVGYGYTTATGDYTVAGLLPGRYHLFFSPNQAYAAEYYNDAQFQDDATDITVTAGTTQTGKSAVLSRAAHITGTVSRQGGGAVQGASVTVSRYNATNKNWSFVTNTTTSATGSYDASGLAPGTYAVRFSASGYVEQYYGDATTPETSQQVTVAEGATVSGISPTLSTGAALTGTVTGSGNAKLKGIEVSVYQYQSYDGGGYGYASKGSATTDANGTFSVGGLRAGSYRIGFRDPTGGYISEYYDNADDLYSTAAKDVVVGASGSTTVNAALAQGGSLSGAVSGASGPLRYVDVSVYRYDATQGYWRTVGYGYTDTSGKYSVGALAAGAYRLRFSPENGDYAEQYYSDKTTVDDADSVAVAVGQNTVVPGVTLSKGAHITGKVLGDQANGTPAALGSVRVSAYRKVSEPGGGSYWSTVRTAVSDAAGIYDIGNLARGTYHVGFSSTDGHVSEYYADKSSVEAAEDITVGGGATASSIDATLALGATISGVVTDESNGALKNVQVSASRVGAGASDYFNANATTSSTGAYTLTGLPAGSYKIWFSDYSGGHLQEYWNDKTTYAQADPVVVAAGSTLTGISPHLSTAAHITGTVTGPDDKPVGDVSVRAYSRYLDDDGTYYWGWDQSAVTDAQGHYDIGGLATGSYRLGFFDTDHDLGTQYYQNAAEVEDAADVGATAGQVVTGKDVKLSPGGGISGTVRGPGGAALHSGWVDAYVQNSHTHDWDFVKEVDVDTAGAYVLRGLRPATYRIGFGGTDSAGKDLAGEYWNDKATVEEADDIAVAAGQVSGSKDAVLQSGSTLTGTVKNQSGAAVESDVNIYRKAPDGTFKHYTWGYADSATGAYSAGGLPAGTYKVGFEPYSDAYAPEFYDDKPSLEAATPLTIDGTGSPTASAVLAAAPVGGAISNLTAPAITGTAKVGETLTASGGTWSPNDVTKSYQWYAGGTAISGATTSTYLVMAGDVSQQLSVQVTASKTGFTSATKASAPTAAVVKATISPTAKPVVTGNAVVGQTLTATGGTWIPGDVTLAYQWLAGGTAITGATASTYTLTAGERGKAITVQVTASKAGYDGATSISDATAPVGDVDLPDLSNTVKPVVSGTAKVGETLTAGTGTWNQTPDSFAFQWLAGTTEIVGATSSTYVAAAGDVGTTISVRVRASKAGYDPASAASDPTAAVVAGTITGTAAPVVTGTAQVGQTLSTTGGSWNPADVARSYQWTVGGTAVSGATGASYAVQVADVGKVVTVTVSASRAGYTSASATSAPTGAVAAATVVVLPPPPPATQPTVITNITTPVISGAALVGKKLSVSAGSWSPSTVQVSYQWLLNGKAISGATSSSLKLKASMAGKKITVAVTASATGSTAVTVTSKATKKIKAKTKPKPKPKNKKVVLDERLLVALRNVA